MKQKWFLDNEDIVRRYLGGESESSISRSLGVSRITIHSRLLFCNVKPRNAVEASNLLRFKTFEITEPFMELLDGLLLGDASIEKNVHSESRLEISQHKKRLGWLQEISEKLSGFGIKNKITDRGVRGFQLRTAKYKTFSLQRDRWYNSIKIVPDDVRITPLSIAQWYWGDGASSKYTMEFCTDSFALNDVKRLAANLSSQIIAKTLIRKKCQSKGYRIYVGTKEGRYALTKMIAPYCPLCCRYKLEVRHAFNGNN